MFFEFLAAASVAPPSPSWKCEGCTPDEKIALAYIQERTNITDRNALATIMGILSKRVSLNLISVKVVQELLIIDVIVVDMD